MIRPLNVDDIITIIGIKENPSARYRELNFKGVVKEIDNDGNITVINSVGGIFLIYPPDKYQLKTVEYKLNNKTFRVW